MHTPFLNENLGGCSDREIWEASLREARFLITQDLDFSDVRQFRPGTHQGIYWCASTQLLVKA